MGEDSGWKQVHGDVFRQPPNLILFSALIGTGVQLLLLVLSVIMISIIATLYSERGAMVTACIVCYILSAFFGGYTSGGYVIYVLYVLLRDYLSYFTVPNLKCT